MEFIQIGKAGKKMMIPDWKLATATTTHSPGIWGSCSIRINVTIV
jgi:hypothetical protein